MFDIRPFNRRNSDLFERFARNFDEVFIENYFPTSDGKLNSLRTDIIENKDAYFVEAHLSGFSNEDIQIEVEGNQFTIRAKRQECAELKEEYDKIAGQEGHFDELVHQFYISNVDQDKVEASFEDGVLKIKFPKIKVDNSGPTKRIKIQ